MNFSSVNRVSAVLMLFAVAILSSCGITLESRTELLTAGPWTFQSFTNPDAEATQVAFIRAIFTGAEANFSEDGTYTITLADSLFDVTTGTWEFSEDATMFIQDKGTGEENTSDIIELTKETFSFAYSDTTGLNTLTWVQ